MILTIITAIVLTLYGAWLCGAWINLIKNKNWQELSAAICATVFWAFAVSVTVWLA